MPGAKRWRQGATGRPAGVPEGLDFALPLAGFGVILAAPGRSLIRQQPHQRVLAGNGFGTVDNDYSIKMQGEVCLITFSLGTVVTPEMIKKALSEELLVDQREIIKDIWDFRGCTPSKDFTFESMHRLVESIRSLNNYKWVSQTALLVDENLAFGVTRMFLSLSGRLPSEICVFSKESEAYEFLGLKPA